MPDDGTVISMSARERLAVLEATIKQTGSKIDKLSSNVECLMRQLNERRGGERLAARLGYIVITVVAAAIGAISPHLLGSFTNHN